MEKEDIFGEGLIKVIQVCIAGIVVLVLIMAIATSNKESPKPIGTLSCSCKE